MLLWASVAYVVAYVEPELLKDVGVPGSYLPFFVILWVAISYTLVLVLKSIRYGALLGSTIMVGVVATALKLMFWGLAVVVLLTLVIESWYIYRSYEKNHSVHESKNRGSSL